MVSTKPAGAENTWCKSPITKINTNTNVKLRKRSVRNLFAKKEVQTSLPCDYCLFQKTRSLHSFSDSKHVIFKYP